MRNFMICTAAIGLTAILAATSEASLLLGTTNETNDAASVNDVAGTSFTQSKNLRAKLTAAGSTEGDLVGSFSVMDADAGAYDNGDLSVRWWLENVPELVEPIYVTIKYGILTDVYQWNTGNGDLKENNGDGTFDYHSMFYMSPSQNAIGHVGVLNIPEPTGLVLCQLGAILCLFSGRRWPNRCRGLLVKRLLVRG